MAAQTDSAFTMIFFLEIVLEHNSGYFSYNVYVSKKDQGLRMERTFKKVREETHNPLLNQLCVSCIPGKFLLSLFGKLIRCLFRGIQQLRGPNFTIFCPPSPSSGKTWTFYILITEYLPFSRDPPWTFHWSPNPLFLFTLLLNDP